MTRLISDWILDMPDMLDEYDEELLIKTGVDLRGLVASAAGTSPGDLQKLVQDNKVAIIRINTGQGVIDGFDRAVAAILRHMGAETITCERENVSGVYEAKEAGANIIFTADDDRFIAVNTENNKMAENDYCTALGYTHALEKMAGGLKGKDIALLGYGRVGKFASEFLSDRGGKVWLYEQKLVEKQKADRFVDLIPDKKSLVDFKLMFDATNTGGWMTGLGFRDTFISAPGIPLSFDEDKIDGSNTYIHDMLQLGTAVMLMKVL